MLRTENKRDKQRQNDLLDGSNVFTATTVCLCFHCPVLLHPSNIAARERKHHHKGFLYDGIIHTLHYIQQYMSEKNYSSY